MMNNRTPRIDISDFQAPSPVRMDARFWQEVSAQARRVEPNDVPITIVQDGGRKLMVLDATDWAMLCEIIKREPENGGRT